jgi:DNA-directed RNA polymerase specialized sigma subunit
MKTIMDYLATAPIPPIMTSIDTRALIRKMRQNDGQSESAREELVNSGLLLILIVLLRFTDRQEPLTRLFHVGLAGLAKAIVLFDLEQSFDFVPYALSMISKEIRHHLGEDTAT